MKRYVVCAAVALVLFLGGLSMAGPVGRSIVQAKAEVASFDTYHLPLAFKGGEQAGAVAIGNYSSYAGLYVYDNFGNCVAWDDDATPSTCDDLGITWVPGKEATYTVEIRNFGVMPNVLRTYAR